MNETTAQAQPAPLVLFRRRCRACGKPLAFVQTPAGRAAPMEVDEDGQVTAVNHFRTCPSAKQFHRKRAADGRA